MKWFEGGLHSPTQDHDDDCHDDVMLPPGGRPRPAPAFEDGPDPCYIDHHGRDLRIDLLRGFFVVAMIVDHVRGPSPLYLLTGGNRFYASAAEGFILTSGLVAGLVYHRMIERLGLGPALLKVLQRAVTLYLVTIGLTLLILPVAEMLDLPFAQGIDASNPLRVIVSVLTLHQTYYLVDVMLLYTVLFLVSPLAFVLLDRGHTWVVLGASWLLWGLYQVYPELVSLPWPINGNYLFNFSAWQVLFFTGLVIGYRQDRLPLFEPPRQRVPPWFCRARLAPPDRRLLRRRSAHRCHAARHRHRQPDVSRRTRVVAGQYVCQSRPATGAVDRIRSCLHFHVFCCHSFLAAYSARGQLAVVAVGPARSLRLFGARDSGRRHRDHSGAAQPGLSRPAMA